MPKQGHVWSEEYGCYVSESLATSEKKSKEYGVDLTQCTIKENQFGFFDLLCNGKKIQRISFDEYIELRNVVASVQLQGGY